MGKEQNSEYYNRVFSKSDMYHSSFDKMYGHGKNWAKIWESSLPILIENNVKSILDIGSGMGQFGQLTQQLDIQYKGIDFSEYAINHSINHKVGGEEYECVNALTYHYNDVVDCYISHEFLEHVEKDIEILQKLTTGKLIIFSIPSFDDPGHVRVYPNEEYIINRYSDTVSDIQIKRITPAIHFLCWGIIK